MPFPPLLLRAAALVATLVLATTACVLPVVLLGPTVHAVRALGHPSADAGAAGATALLAVAALAASGWLAVGVAVALFDAGTRTACTFARAVPTRRLVDALVAVAVSGTIGMGALPTAHAATSTSAALGESPGHVLLEVGPDGRFVVRDVHATTTTTTTTDTPTTIAVATPTTTVPAPPPSATAPAPAPSLDLPRHPSTPPTAPERAPRRHVVARGEHLWSIARLVLGERLGHLPTDAELVPYWRRVCDGNRARLRSGDVDLVFPGEVVELPEP